MGVSATHLDWTMVPYVRKSFYKHFMDGMKYLEDEIGEAEFKAGWYGQETNPKDVSIKDDVYRQFYLPYKYAMDMTEKEVHQSVEGMYHNLNTLQSRSGNQLNIMWLAS